MLLFTKAFSQEEAFYMEFKDEKLISAIDTIEDIYKVVFSFKDENINNKKITIAGDSYTLNQLLSLLENQTKLVYKIVEDKYILVSVKDEIPINTLDVVVVKSYLAKGIKKTNKGSYKIKPEKLGILPGLIEPDLLESIQLLPGVLSPNETATGFYVRGGFADQNRLIWDGINLYHKGHLFGMISPINPNVASEIEFTNKGTNPRYGERLSSVINITSKDKIPDKTKAELGINGLNIDALVEVPIIKNKLNILASARSSYTNIFETPTFNQLANKVFESTKIDQNENGNNNFSYSDFNLKLNYKPNENNSLFASFIHIDNSLDFLLDQSDDNTQFNDLLDIKNTGYGFGWKKKWSESLEQNVQAFFSDYSLNYNFITSENGEQISNFEKRNTIFDSGISIEFDYKPSTVFNYTFGYQYTLKDVAYAFLNTSDLTFILDTEDTTVQSHSVFGNAVYSNPEFMDISFGLRSSYFKELDEVKLEPRLQLLKSINSNLNLQATAEVRNQILSEINETVFSDLSLENNIWRLSNADDFPIKNSLQVTFGFIYNKNGYSLDVDTYYKKLENITALSLGFLNPENTGFNLGEQNIYGLDIFLKKRLQRFNIWTSYSFNNARNTFENINNNNSFKSKSNVTHALSTALSYQLNDFQFSLGWKWQTGRPFTEANINDDVVSFDNGVNTGQLPDYHRLDFSSTYSFSLSSTTSLRGKIGFSVRNLYNRRSLISREYRGNNNINDPIEIIDRFSLGITPNLLFRIYW
jgi:hypothetical protein